MRFGALIVALLLCSLPASAAQITISGSYEVTSVTPILGTPGQTLGENGSWVFDVQWTDESGASTTGFSSVTLGFTPSSGTAWEYNTLKGGASPTPTMDTAKVGSNTLWNVDDFAFDPASAGVIGNSSASLDYQAITDVNVAGSALSQSRVQEIVDKAFQSEGTLTAVSVTGGGTIIWLSEITLFGPTVVPEPSSIGLFAVLAAGAGAIVYRRRRSS